MSARLVGGLHRTAPSLHSGTLENHSSRLHCLCTPVQTVNTAALSKLPAWTDLSDCTPQLTPSESSRPLRPPPRRQTNFERPCRREENHYFKSVWLFVRVAQDTRVEDGKAQAVFIDLCSPLISLTGSWFIEMGPRVCQGYGSKHPARSPALRVTWNWGQLTVRQTHAPAIPYTSHRVLIKVCFGLGLGSVGGGGLVGRKKALGDKLSAVMRWGKAASSHQNLTSYTTALIMQHWQYRHQTELLITLQHAGKLTNK